MRDRSKSYGYFRSNPKGSSPASVLLGMASARAPSHRYASVDSRSSSDPSPPSSGRKNSGKNLSYLRRLIGNGGGRGTSDPALAAAPRTENYSGALVTAREAKRERNNFGSLVKKLVEKRTNLKLGSGDRLALAVPDDVIAKELKKYSNGSHLSTLSKKLSQKGGAADKALTEVKTNTRTLAMVLRSERDLLAKNEEYEAEISELRLLIEEKDREVEKLKDMCLKQREEIKALKDAILFPDVINSQLQELLEEQDFELKQAKQVIPSLQNQVTSLTGQLQCLAADLAEVKADKYGVKTCSDSNLSSPRTPKFYQEAANQLEYSSGDYMASERRILDDMFLKDLNPCLTPFSKMKSQEKDELVYGSPENGRLFRYDTQLSRNMICAPNGGALSKSSEHRLRPSSGSNISKKVYKSDENKHLIAKPHYPDLS